MPTKRLWRSPDLPEDAARLKAIEILLFHFCGPYCEILDPRESQDAREVRDISYPGTGKISQIFSQAKKILSGFGSTNNPFKPNSRPIPLRPRRKPPDKSLLPPLRESLEPSSWGGRGSPGPGVPPGLRLSSDRQRSGKLRGLGSLEDGPSPELRTPRPNHRSGFSRNLLAEGGTRGREGNLEAVSKHMAYTDER